MIQYTKRWSYIDKSQEALLFEFFDGERQRVENKINFCQQWV